MAAGLSILCRQCLSADVTECGYEMQNATATSSFSSQTVSTSIKKGISDDFQVFEILKWRQIT